MEMIKAFRAHRIDQGNHRVTVGVLDTGIQADHPDLRSNFNRQSLAQLHHTTCPTSTARVSSSAAMTRRAGTTTAHGTHVAGTIAAALNGMGVSGVAPKVSLVNIRGGQDSGYFFLGPVAHALTYAGDKGIDVVNMSFYVDPWLYNCVGGAPEDSPEQAAEQEVIIEAMTRALRYAHRHDVTLVGSLGNNHEDLANPRHDFSSPDYPVDTAYERTIDNDTCFDLPVEGPHVLGISALGPSGKKSDFSNYATDLGSGEIELSAPGGWFRDGFGTDTFQTIGNEILSTAPTHVMQEEGLVDENGERDPGRRRGGRPEVVQQQGPLWLLPVPAGHLDGVSPRVWCRSAGGERPRPPGRPARPHLVASQGQVVDVSNRHRPRLSPGWRAGVPPGGPRRGVHRDLRRD